MACQCAWQGHQNRTTNLWLARRGFRGPRDVPRLRAGGAHRRLLTELLREEWQFTGTVVADYFGVSFLET
ncbi:hypothetical protein, partial [Streptomyces mirabilis]